MDISHINRKGRKAFAKRSIIAKVQIRIFHSFFFVYFVVKKLSALCG